MVETFNQRAQKADIDFGDKRLIPTEFIKYFSYDPEREEPPRPPYKEHFLYLHLRHSKILYVGITQNWESRLRTHAKSSPWFPAVDQIYIEGWLDKESVLLQEQRLVRMMQPFFNRDRMNGCYLSHEKFLHHLQTLYANLDEPEKWPIRACTVCNKQIARVVKERCACSVGNYDCLKRKF